MTKFINPFQIHNFTILMRCCCLVFKYIPSSPRYFEAGQCSVTLREGYSALFCVVVLSIEPSKAIEKKVPPLSVDSLFRHSRKTLFVYSSTTIRNETPPLHCSVIQRQFLAPLMLFRSVLCDSGPNRLLNSIFKFKEKHTHEPRVV